VIETAPVFEPLLHPSRYKGAFGGRGSGKSHFMAELMIETAAMRMGFRGLCVREVQKSLKESAKRLLEDKIASLGVSKLFDITQTEIRTPGGGLIAFTGMQDHTAESVKSFEGFDVAWVEEASSLSQRSLTLLRPTIRKEGSEIWATWNPRFARDPIDELLRGENPPPDAIVVRANYNDNIWFPATLEAERQYDEQHKPEQYAHIWEGDYAKVFAGAYYADALALAIKENRVGHVAADPLMVTRAYWDIGGTGAKADATAIWIAQFIGRQILIVDYYEAQGQPLAAHVNWLREKGYSKTQCVLPHDGAAHEKIEKATYEGALREAGFDVRTVANQGAGAAMMRIEATRRLFPSIWFDNEKTKAGREALGAYHEKRDEKRDIGLGPNHDWASHAADAFGLLAIDYEGEIANDPWKKPLGKARRVV
jgi:phage terminase large subunit